jgi:hypothetical protein
MKTKKVIIVFFKSQTTITIVCVILRRKIILKFLLKKNSLTSLPFYVLKFFLSTWIGVKNIAYLD